MITATPTPPPKKTGRTPMWTVTRNNVPVFGSDDYDTAHGYLMHHAPLNFASWYALTRTGKIARS